MTCKSILLAVFAALALSGCAALPLQAREASTLPATSVETLTVTILGSGTPVASETQAGPAILVQADGRSFLFDCGRGCTTRLNQHDTALLTKVDAVFLTHLHSDHVSGLPDLWLNGWAQGRTLPLPIFGPAGAQNILPGLRAAFADDIAYRLADGAPRTTDGLTDVTEIIPDNGGLIYDTDGLRITAFPVEHGATTPFGYRIEYAGQVVVLSGDTTLTPTLSEASNGADVLLLEVLSPAMVRYIRDSFPEDVADRIIGLHMTAEQTSQLLTEAQPTLGVYYHTVNNPRSAAGLMKTTARLYGGDVLVSSDLLTITLSAGEVCAEAPGTGEKQCAGRR